jgi:hypothetical protein
VYCRYQEHLVFIILMAIVFIFQISSIAILKYMGGIEFIFLISLNILIFWGMIRYARWIWRKISFHTALSRVVLIEFFFAILFAILFIVFRPFPIYF